MDHGFVRTLPCPSASVSFLSCVDAVRAVKSVVVVRNAGFMVPVTNHESGLVMEEPGLNPDISL